MRRYTIWTEFRYRDGTLAREYGEGRYWLRKTAERRAERMNESPVLALGAHVTGVTVRQEVREVCS